MIVGGNIEPIMKVLLAQEGDLNFILYVWARCERISSGESNNNKYLTYLQKEHSKCEIEDGYMGVILESGAVLRGLSAVWVGGDSGCILSVAKEVEREG